MIFFAPKIAPKFVVTKMPMPRTMSAVSSAWWVTGIVGIGELVAMAMALILERIKGIARFHWKPWEIWKMGESQTQVSKPRLWTWLTGIPTNSQCNDGCSQGPKVAQNLQALSFRFLPHSLRLKVVPPISLISCLLAVAWDRIFWPLCVCCPSPCPFAVTFWCPICYLPLGVFVPRKYHAFKILGEFLLFLLWPYQCDQLIPPGKKLQKTPPTAQQPNSPTASSRPHLQFRSIS